MNDEKLIKIAQNFYDLGKPYEVLKILKENQLSTKDEYLLLAETYMLLCQYQDALNAYHEAMMIYLKTENDVMKQISFKADLRKKTMEADKLLSFSYKKDYQYLYDYDDVFVFLNLDTFEELKVNQSDIKYLKLESSKDYSVIFDARNHSILNIVEKQ